MKNYFILILIISMLQSCKDDCKNIQVPYAVKVPFTESILKNVSLNYKTSTLIDDRFPGIPPPELSSLLRFVERRPILFASITVSNISKHDGNFGFSVTWECIDQEIIGLSSAFIPAGMSKQIKIHQEIDHYDCKDQFSVKKFEIIAPTVQITEVSTKYREEIRYRLCNSCDEACVQADKVSKN
ncbi:MAG: hypothetical protein HOP11_10895 [Saprospiraceae bacterium]|nr:hypothetical protein [Saprospiraceae bacterium]